MAPKKKAKSSRASRSAGGMVAGVSISEMSREQLEQFVQRVQKELEREREERNYYQLENDKLRTFWEITRQNLEEQQALVRNKDKEIEEIAEKHEDELKLCHQKVKHLIFEQHTSLTEMKLENMLSQKYSEDERLIREKELIAEKRNLRCRIRELKDIHLDQLRTVHLECEEKSVDLRTKYEAQIADLESRYQKEIKDLQEEMNSNHERSLYELEEKNECHVRSLLETHRSAFDDMKAYYSKIVQENMLLVSALKNEVKNLKDVKNNLENEIRILRNENQKLLAPLQFCKQQIAELNKKLELLERDQRTWKVTLKQIRMGEEKFKKLKCLYDALLLVYEEVYEEHEMCKDKITQLQLQIKERGIRKNGISNHNVVKPQRSVITNPLLDTKFPELIYEKS